MLPGFEVARRRLNPLMSAKSILGAMTVLIEKVNEVVIPLKEDGTIDGYILDHSARAAAINEEAESEIATEAVTEQKLYYIIANGGKAAELLAHAAFEFTVQPCSKNEKTDRADLSAKG